MSSLFSKLFGKKTPPRVAGGLRKAENHVLKAYNVPTSWESPRFIDSRGYLLPCDDQGNTSMCGGYGMSGIQEALSWWQTGVRASVDPKQIYSLAKAEFDPNKDEGTTLEAVIAAARKLNYLSNVEVYDITSAGTLQYALHKFPLVLLGLDITDAWSKAGDDGKIKDSNRSIGGHCIIGCGYDAYGPRIANSWGCTWGDEGFGHLSWNQFYQQFMCAKGFIIK